MIGKGQEALLCVEDVAQMLTDAQDAHILGAALLSNWLNPLLLDEVSPLGSTALVTAVSIPSSVRSETSRLGPKMTGPTESEDRWGMRLPHRRDRELPRSPERARTGSTSGDVGSVI